MMNNTPAKTLRRLTDLETGSSVARIKLDAAEEARLSELGLRPGAEIRRLHGEAGQSILIGVGDGRIGVNFDTAKRIYVF
jgi:ferrous iron transport protein A